MRLTIHAPGMFHCLRVWSPSQHLSLEYLPTINLSTCQDGDNGDNWTNHLGLRRKKFAIVKLRSLPYRQMRLHAGGARVV